MVNRKLLLLPAVLIASTLTLAGCTADNNTNPTVDPNPVPTTSETSTATPPEGLPGPGETPDPETMATITNERSIADPETWQFFADSGATLPADDPAVRETTAEEIINVDPAQLNEVFGNLTADVEQSAVNVENWIRENNATVTTAGDVPGELLVNRYPNATETYVIVDTAGGVYVLSRLKVTSGEQQLTLGSRVTANPVV